MDEFFPTRIFEVDTFLFFVLILMRVSGLFVSMPIIGSLNVPMMVKTGLSGLIAMLLVAVMPPLSQGIPHSLGPFLVIGAYELLIGIGMGFIVSLMFSAIQIAGELMETQFPIFGFYLFILWSMFFLWVNGHLVVLQVLGDSYKSLPIGILGSMDKNFGWEIAKLGQIVFVFGVRLAGPIIVTMILAYAVMGILGRAIPQIHLLVIGFPITIGLGMTVIGLSLNIYVGVFDEMAREMVREVQLFIRGLG
jgi:flagellar biosynthetic protein FliR